MTPITDPQVVTAAEAARLLGVTRQQVLELAAAAGDFPPAQLTATGDRVWPWVAIQEWAVAHPHPGPGPVFSVPEVPALPQRPPRVQQVLDLASRQASILNHDWIGPDHLILGLLDPDCPGAARAVLESFGIRAELLRQAFVESMGDPYDTEPAEATLPPITQLLLERANLEAARLADAEVTSEHVLLAVSSVADGSFAIIWLTRRGIDPDIVRRRVVEVTEGVALPAPTPPADPALEVDPAAALGLAPNPLGHDPRRRRPWGSMPFGVPEDRPPRSGMLPRQYLIDRDGYPVLTTDGQPVHVVVNEHGLPVLDEQGQPMLGPVEVPPGAEITTKSQPDKSS
jgi:Clp amino terminal domain, pathogenicity island component